MASVYLAEQVSVKRPVALKILHPGISQHKDIITRFHREAVALGMLSHPNIATVHASGTENGVHFLAMEYCPGQSLQTLLDGREAAPEATGSEEQTSTRDPRDSDADWQQFVVETAVRVAAALSCAHKNGVLHRDVKPSNIMVDRATGGVWVVDFGLARVVHSGEASLTVGLLGTPRYSSPEQLAGCKVDARSDIYSLGAALRRLLSTPVLESADADSVSFRWLDDVSEDIQLVIARATEPDPELRYATMKDLREDLLAVSRREPPRVRKSQWLRKSWLVVRRNKKTLVAATIILTLFCVAGFFLFEKRQEALRQVDKTKAESAIGFAHREWLANNVARTEEILDEYPEADRHWEWRYLKRLCDTSLLTFRGHQREVTSVAFSPDGQRIASTSWEEAKVWEAATGKVLYTSTGEMVGLDTVAFSPNGRRVAFAGFKLIHIIDVESGRELLSIPAYEDGISCVAYSPDGKRLASSSSIYVRSGGGVKVWSTETGKELLKIEVAQGFNSVAFSPDGRLIASGGASVHMDPPVVVPSAITLWDASNGQFLRSFPGLRFEVTSVAFSPDGRRLASGSPDTTVRLWDVETGEEIRSMQGHTGWVRQVSFSPYGLRIASAGDDRAVKLWNALTGQEIFTIRGHRYPIHGVILSPDGKRLATASGDGMKFGEVKIWDAAAEQEHAIIDRYNERATSVDFSPDGKLLVSSGRSHSSAEPAKVIARSVATGDEVYSFDPLQVSFPGFECVRFSPDGQRLVAVGQDGGGVVVLDVTSGEMLRVRPLDMGSYGNKIAFSRDGNCFTVSTNCGPVIFYMAGNTIKSLEGHKLPVIGLAFSPDGHELASINQGGYMMEGVTGLMLIPSEIKLREIETGKEIFSVSSPGSCVAFSPDGREIASGGSDGVVHLLSSKTGKEARSLRRHSGMITSLAYSPDGERLVSGGADQVLKVWDMVAGIEVITLHGPTGSVTDVAFSPDGARIAASSEDGTVRLWDAGAPAKASR